MVKERKPRFSKQRECVYEVLQSTTTHPTAAWIYERVQKKIPDISLGTVYRNLSKLCDDGRVYKIDVGDGTERYDAFSDPHYHLYCKECGCVCDIVVDYMHEVDEIGREKTGYSIDYHNLLFSGLCKKCTDKNSKAENKV